MFALLVTVFWYRKAGIFAVIPGFQTRVPCHHRHYVIMEKKKLGFQTCTPHVLAHPLLSHPLQSCRGLFTLPSNH